MRVRPSMLVAAPLVLAVAVTSTAFAQEREQHEAHAGQEAKAKDAMTVTLSEVNESAIEGKAVISHAEDAEGMAAHQVKVKLTGATEGQTYPAHVHQGSCEEGGPVVTGLTSVEADAEGASSTTVVAAADLRDDEAEDAQVAEAAERTEGDEGDEQPYVEARGDIGETPAMAGHGALFIQVHAPDGQPVACGDIEPAGDAHERMHEEMHEGMQEEDDGAESEDDEPTDG